MTLRCLCLTVLAVATVTISSPVAQEKPAAKPWQPPRTSSGQPDIQGIWASNSSGAAMNIEPPVRRVQPGATAAPRNNRTILLDPPTGILPYQPWARARRDEAMKEVKAPSPAMMDPQVRGWPNGVPRANIYSTHDGAGGGPIQIMQPSGYVVFLYEIQHEDRIVPLDGRPKPGKDVRLWMGSSHGRWEGNTLVIEVTNNNDSTRFDISGNFHSDEMRVTERWTFVDKDTLEYRATIDDPKVYTAPWTLGVTHKRGPAGNEILEYAGVEGDRSLETAAALVRAKEAKEAKEGASSKK